MGRGLFETGPPGRTPFDRAELPDIPAKDVAQALSLLEGCVDQWQTDAPIKDIAIQEIKNAIAQARRDLGVEREEVIS